MTAAFAAAAAVAVVAIVVLVLTARRGRERLGSEQARVGELEEKLQEEADGHRQALEERRQAVEERQHADEHIQQAEEQIQHAEEQIQHAEEQTQHAEERVLAAEAARLEAVQRAERAERSFTGRQDDVGVDAALLDLERLRVEREWGEVTGTAEPLPQPWDGSMQAAVAAELEIVREVIGVPTRVEAAGAPGLPAPRASGGAARLTAELLRSLARVGEELAVSFAADGAVIIRVATVRADPQPDLAAFGTVAAALGGDLSVHPITDGFEARLHLPGPPRSSSPG
jgi:hypothetical protein